MAYFPDGTAYSYLGDEPRTVNIGWLDGDHPFPTGTPSEVFLAALARACRHGVKRTRGWHRCQLCTTPDGRALPYPTTARDGEGEFPVGDAEIRVAGSDGIVFAAPDMIIHYVAEHRYRPPEAFQAAVLREEPLPE